MKTTLKAFVLLSGLALLAGCPGKPPEPTAKPAAVTTPWDGMKKDEQRARDVQKTVDQQAAQQRAQLDAAEK
jgi:predicted small lipoprotein YifL